MRPYGPAALRLCVGTVFLAHGAQKLFGVWGGSGLAGTTALITSFGLTPAYPLAILTAVAELGGGVLLILGGLTRWVALVLAVEIAVAIWKVNYPNGFFLTVGNRSRGRVPAGPAGRAALPGADRARRPVGRRMAEFVGRGPGGRTSTRAQSLERRMRLSGGAALITGGKRIGAAVAKALAVRRHGRRAFL